MENNCINSIINDSLLSLIIRFVGGNKDINFCDNEFIQKQINDIQNHIERYPTEEQNYQALVWIERYAKTYREQWEKEIITRELRYQRCIDCPLTNTSDHACQIHQEWLDLLQSYIQGGINSRQYVEQALHLLDDHKQVLKLGIDSNVQLGNRPD